MIHVILKDKIKIDRRRMSKIPVMYYNEKVSLRIINRIWDSWDWTVLVWLIIPSTKISIDNFCKLLEVTLRSLVPVLQGPRQTCYTYLYFKRNYNSAGDSKRLKNLVTFSFRHTGLFIKTNRQKSCKDKDIERSTVLFNHIGYVKTSKIEILFF